MENAETSSLSEKRLRGRPKGSTKSKMKERELLALPGEEKQVAPVAKKRGRPPKGSSPTGPQPLAFTPSLEGQPFVPSEQSKSCVTLKLTQPATVPLELCTPPLPPVPPEHPYPVPPEHESPVLPVPPEHPCPVPPEHESAVPWEHQLKVAEALSAKESALASSPSKPAASPLDSGQPPLASVSVVSL